MTLAMVAEHQRHALYDTVLKHALTLSMAPQFTGAAVVVVVVAVAVVVVIVADVVRLDVTVAGIVCVLVVVAVGLTVDVAVSVIDAVGVSVDGGTTVVMLAMVVVSFSACCARAPMIVRNPPLRWRQCCFCGGPMLIMASL